MKTYRAFLAVPLGDEIVRAATELSVQLRRRLREATVRAKWVHPQNMHVTLRFLGNIADEQGRALGEALGPVVRGHASFLARFGALGAFPSPARPSVLWIGVCEGAEAMTNLGVDVGRAVTALGFPEEDRPFHAHVTLARFRRGGAPDLTALVDEHSAWDAGSTVVREVLLYESTLRPRGPVYHPVWRGTLHPGGAPRAAPSAGAEPGTAKGEQEK